LKEARVSCCNVAWREDGRNEAGNLNEKKRVLRSEIHAASGREKR